MLLYYNSARVCSYYENTNIPIQLPFHYSNKIRNIYSLRTFTVFRLHVSVLHHQGELMRPLLKNTRCYASIICGHYKSCRKLQNVQFFIY